MIVVLESRPIFVMAGRVIVVVIDRRVIVVIRRRPRMGRRWGTQVAMDDRPSKRGISRV